MASLEGKPWKTSLRDTPNATTGVAPSELFLGCKLRTTLHILHTGPSTDATVQARVHAHQSQVKTYTHIKCAAKPSVLRPGDRLRVMSTHMKRAVKIRSTLYSAGGKRGYLLLLQLFLFVSSIRVRYNTIHGAYVRNV